MFKPFYFEELVLQVVAARGQWDPYNRWKAHQNCQVKTDPCVRNDQNCKVRDLRKHYDPARLQLEALEEARVQKEAKAKEIAEAKSESTAAAFLGALDSLALTSSRSPSPHRRFMHDE